MTDAIPEALAEAVEIRRRRRTAARRWVILDNETSSAEGFAASVNSAKHRRLADRFRPEGWITEYL